MIMRKAYLTIFVGFIETLAFLTKHEANHIAKINQLLNQLTKQINKK